MFGANNPFFVIFFLGTHALILIGLSYLLWWTSNFLFRTAIKTAQSFSLPSPFIKHIAHFDSHKIFKLALVGTAIRYGFAQHIARAVVCLNFTLLTLVVGVAAIYGKTLPFSHKKKERDYILLLLVFLLVGVMFLRTTLDWWHGLIFIMMYVIFLFYSRRSASPAHRVSDEVRGNRLIFVFLLFASMWFVGFIARAVIFSPLSYSGVVFLSFTLAIPELILSFKSIQKKEHGIVIRNLIGSVFENTTLWLGLLVCFSPSSLWFTPLLTSAPFMLVAFLLLVFSLALRGKITRWEGVGFLTVYGAFITYRLLRVI